MNQAAAISLPTVTGQVQENTLERLVLQIPESSYRVHLAIDGPIDAQVGDRVRGVIYCQARRVDVFPAGGWFVEPVFGRPRRAQGRIVGGDVQQNRLFVKVARHATLVSTLMPSQQVAEFALGQIVGYDIERGARFELQGKA